MYHFQGLSFQIAQTFPYFWCDRWNHSSEPESKLKSLFKSILSSNLSIVVCYALNFFQMVFIQFNAILITHNHILLKRNSSISPSISFVKELTQSCNDLSFHCLFIFFTFKASELDVYFTSMLSSITNIFCYNRHHSSVWSQINLIIVMSAEKYIYVNEDIYSEAFFVLDFPACRFISD